MNDDKICKHCFVKGRVQGVYFRYYTLQQAQHLGVTGWARNLNDGRVEVLACGETKAVENLCVWLHEGSPLSNVTEVKCQIINQPDYPKSFEIG